MALPTSAFDITNPKTNTIDSLAEVTAIGKGFFVAWNRADLDPGGVPATSVVGQFYDANGNAKGKLITLEKSGAPMNGRVEVLEMGGGKVAAFWAKGEIVKGAIVDTVSGKVGKAVEIGRQGDLIHDVVHLGKGKIGMVMSQTDISNPFNMREKISLITLDSKLKVLSGPTSVHGNGFPIDPWNALDHTIVATGKGGLVLYRDRADDKLLAQAFTDNGKLEGKAFQVNTTKLDLPTLVEETLFNIKAEKLEKGEVVVWTSREVHEGRTSFEIRARMFDEKGKPVGKDFLVNENFGGNQLYPEIIELDGGRFAIAWATNNILSLTFHIRYYDAAGRPLSGEIVTENLSLFTDLDFEATQLADGSIVNVWADKALTASLNADGIALPKFGTAKADALAGTNGDDTILAGAGDDAINARRGDDILFGGSGKDRFIFRKGDGADTIHDFGNGRDQLDLKSFKFASLQKVLDRATQQGDDVVINLGGQNSVTLVGVDKEDLGKADFLL